MGFFDWNGDGEIDTQDTFLEYNIYKEWEKETSGTSSDEDSKTSSDEDMPRYYTLRNYHTPTSYPTKDDITQSETSNESFQLKKKDIFFILFMFAVVIFLVSIIISAFLPGKCEYPDCDKYSEKNSFYCEEHTKRH